MPYKKGQSGNPSGRPKITLPDGSSLRDLARSHTVECIEALIGLVRGADNEAVVRAAAVDLLDRGWGKPTQLIGGDETAAPIRTEVGLDAIVATLLNRTGATETDALRALAATPVETLQ